MTISEKLSQIRGRHTNMFGEVNTDMAHLLEAVEAVLEEADKGRGPHAPYLTDYELGKYEALDLIGSILEEHLGGRDDER